MNYIDFVMVLIESSLKKISCRFNSIQFTFRCGCASVDSKVSKHLFECFSVILTVNPLVVWIAINFITIITSNFFGINPTVCMCVRNACIQFSNPRKSRHTSLRNKSVSFTPNSKQKERKEYDTNKTNYILNLIRNSNHEKLI